MHDRVNQTAIRILDALREGVRRVEMVVPEQDQRPNECARSFHQPGLLKNGFQFRVQFGLRAYTGSWPRAKLRWFRRGKELLQTSGQDVAHAAKLAKRPAKPKR